MCLAALPSAALAQGYGGAPSAPDVGAPGLDRRMDKLEEQIVDLQSQTAALESLANSGSASSGAAGGYAAGGDLEAQVRALAAQVADLSQKLQQMERQLGFSTAPRGAPAAGIDRESPAPPRGAPPPSFADRGVDRAVERPPALGAPDRSGFGSTTVEPDGFPPRSGPAASAEPPRRFAGSPPPATGFGAAPGPDAAQPSRLSSAEARSLYDQAYGSLVKREYDAAETYFTQFLRQHPNDPLAGAAQFWLGETAFVSGEYRQAADLFLKSYTNYPASEKAPESLLKLGISLKRLGEGSAACDTFRELEQRFPTVQAVMQRAQAEKRRSNC
ncbi:MAG: tol-pal system protein YbgF [Hyphomicrobiales bacterium]|nr:tol-pal system protein YbgF [Hyphomicrobiales bacterium]